VAAALLIARLDVHAAPPEDNKEVSQLLEDIKDQAAALQRDSDELETFTRSDMSWQSHAEELDALKSASMPLAKPSAGCRVCATLAILELATRHGDPTGNRARLAANGKVEKAIACRCARAWRDANYTGNC
jgi:hypothetical protein